MVRKSYIAVAAVVCLGAVACSSEDASEQSADSPQAQVDHDEASTSEAGTEDESDDSADDETNGESGESNDATDDVEAMSTEPRTLPPPDSTVVLTGVTTEEDGDIERIVFEVSDTEIPGLSAKYVEVVRIDDEPVLVQGDAFLELILEGADPNADEGLNPEVTAGLLPEQPLIQEVRWARYLGDTVTFAVGLSRETPFRVYSDDDPGRLVLEFEAS